MAAYLARVCCPRLGQAIFSCDSQAEMNGSDMLQSQSAIVWLVRIPGSHPSDPGSSPGGGILAALRTATLKRKRKLNV
jgi:hypothetical protein